MKQRILLLLALLVLVSFGPAMAQTSPAAAPVPAAVTEFLATLSDSPAPAPSFLTGCTFNYQCPTGQICCYLCGNPPAEGDDSFCRACVEPVKGGGCPMVY
jgi:hypothetical protein